ncbi:MAG: ATP-grasp domain-containing protein [Eggerthellaceae bacterium]|nr:ATP-grasp domain-containing protein [Eggerthellaceae bacterium]
MNCYTVARAIHEQYGLVSYSFGRFAAGDTKYSKIVRPTYVQDLDTPEVLLKTIADFAAKHPEKKHLIWGCADVYAALLCEIQDKLPQNCVTLYISAELRDKLESKSSFYEMCDAYNIPYPKTQRITAKRFQEGLSIAELSSEALGFSYPIIVKPSMSVTYWEYPFEGMKKVYEAKDEQEALHIMSLIFGAGYPDEILLQDMIPGDDSKMNVLTAYCDRNHKVRWMAFGRVGLEEHTATALGNPCAIITQRNPELEQVIKHWLEDIKFTGFANFDIKYDERDKSYRVFEINLRQGRSNYYVTATGLNIAYHVVEDRIFQNDIDECIYNEKEVFWHSVPRKVVYDFVKDQNFTDRAKQLVKKKQESMSFDYSYDLRFNPLRWAYVKIHLHRYYDKFAHSENYK